MTDPGNAVFLSYASEDAEAAFKICTALRTDPEVDRAHRELFGW